MTSQINAHRQARLTELHRALLAYEKNPKSKVFALLANLYRSLEEYEEALEVLRQGLKWHPNYIVARTLLAQVYLGMGQFNSASLEAQKVIDTDPQNISALKTAIQAQLKLNDVSLAKKNIQKLLYHFPKDEKLEKLLGKLSNNNSIQAAPSDLTQFEMKPLSSLFNAPLKNPKIARLQKILNRIYEKQ